MGATASVIPFVAPAVNLAGKLLKGPQMPDMQAPPSANDGANAETADNAAQRAKRRAMGASGRADTILTGPQGLGGVPADGGQVKTLLGL